MYQNKIFKLSLLLIVLVGVAGGLIYLRQASKVVNPAHNDHEELYYCPMHPQVVSEKPGNCPICGMSLVRREYLDHQSSEIPSHAKINISPEKQQRMVIN